MTRVDEEVESPHEEAQGNIFKYYFNQNSLSTGSYPIENFVGIEEYEELRYIPEIKQNAWGELTYSEPLTKEQEREYRLISSPSLIEMKMGALGYERTNCEMKDDVGEDFFLMWKPKDEIGTENAFGFDGWDAVREFTHDVQTLMNDYTVQQLQDRANGNYSVIEYGIYGDREVQAAVKNHPQQKTQEPLNKWQFDETGSLKAEYHNMAQEIGEYETKNNISNEERVTSWFGNMGLYEIKDNVTSEKFFNAYAKAVAFCEEEENIPPVGRIR